MKDNLKAGLLVLLLSNIACQPVIAIGWREATCIFVLVVILLGPPVYRFLRKLEKARENKEK